MIGVVLTELFDKGKDYFKKRYKGKITETYQELGGQLSKENPRPASDDTN